MRRLLRRLGAIGLVGLVVLVAVVVGLLGTGRAGFVVTHGISMNPVYYQGDLVVVARAPTYHVGEIVAYHNRAHHLVVLHRIIGGDATGFIFKGDNNQSTDITRPTQQQLIGRAVLHIPQGGVWLGWLSGKPALSLLYLAMLASGGTVTLSRRGRRRARRNRKGPTVPSDTLPSQPAPARHATAWAARMTPRLRSAAAAIAATGVLGGALAVLAWAGPVDQVIPGAAQAAASMTFGYSAEVPSTAAYDGTTVTSPDPVFRALTKTVDLHLYYQGGARSVAVTAEVSTVDGWHTSLPLVPATEFTNGRYNGVVRLDLDAIGARAAAAAAVTGIPAGMVTVAIAPRLTGGDGAAFAPTLTLKLTPLQLSMAGAVEALTVKDAAPPAEPTRGPRSLLILGRPVLSVTDARMVSGFLLLGALLAAAAVLIATHRTEPLSERASIALRYKALLIRVDPITAPPGSPPVTVPEFHTLARLAERHGLMILHWTRNDSETFMIRDEGITYRYRTEVTPASADPSADTSADASPHPPANPLTSPPASPPATLSN